MPIFRVAFGLGHNHCIETVNGEVIALNKNKILEIEAESCEQARELTFLFVDNKWTFLFKESVWEKVKHHYPTECIRVKYADYFPV